jgi:hypothetical protein
MKTHLLTLALASCALLPAQDPSGTGITTAAPKASPFRFVPADAKFVVRTAAPAKWKQQFSTTQVKKLFETASMAPITGAVAQGVDAMLEELRSTGKFDADLVEKLLTSYTGDFVFAATLDVDGIPEAIANDSPPHFGIVIALTPDGSYDLGKLAAAIEKLAEAEGEFKDLQVGDHRLRCTKNDDEPNVTLPIVIDGQLVCFFSDDVAKFAASALGNGPRFTAPAGDSSLFAHIDVGAIVKTISTVANAVAAPPVDLDKVFDGLGFTTLENATLSIAADGKQLVGSMTLGFREGDRGILGVFAAGKGTPKLLRYVPPGAETFSVSCVDFGALYATIAKVWQLCDEQVPLTWAQAQDAAKEALKVRIKEDLFDHLGGEMLTVQEAAAAGKAPAADPEDPAAAFAGTCLAIALRDGKAFGDSVETALRARGLHAARKTEDYQGLKVHRIKVAALFEIEYAITDDLLVLGLGSDEASQKALRSVLDAHAHPAAAGELPASLKARAQSLGGEWSGVSVSSMANMYRALAQGLETGLRQQLRGVPPPLKMVLDAMGKLGGELERLGLQTSVSTTRVTSRSIENHMRW